MKANKIDPAKIDKLFTSIENILKEMVSELNKEKWKNFFLPLCFYKIINKISENQNEVLNNWEIDERYNWNHIVECAQKNQKNIGEIVDNALYNIEVHNKENLNNANFSKGFKITFENFEPNLNKIILEIENSKIFNPIFEFDKKNYNFDILAHIYEKFLKKFGKFEKLSAGKFYTPVSVVKLMANILFFYFKTNTTKKLNKKELNIYDPTVGSGGMFIQSLNLFNQLNFSKNFYGQEKDSDDCQFARMNLSLYDIFFDLQAGDTILSPSKSFPDKMDIILSNPPFNSKKTDEYKNIPNINGEKIESKYNLARDNSLNFYFMCHIIEKLNKNGKAAILLDENTSTSKSSSLIRKAIIEKDLIHIIIKLPRRIFANTNINVLLYILNKNKGVTKNKILFINAEEERKTKGNQVYLGKENIQNIMNIVNDFLNNKIEKCAIYEKSNVATIEDIAKEDYDLKIEKYVHIKPEEKIDDEKYIQIKTQICKDIDEVNTKLNLLRNKFNEIKDLEKLMNEINSQDN